MWPVARYLFVAKQIGVTFDEPVWKPKRRPTLKPGNIAAASLATVKYQPSAKGEGSGVWRKGTAFATVATWLGLVVVALEAVIRRLGTVSTPYHV